MSYEVEHVREELSIVTSKNKKKALENYIPSNCFDELLLDLSTCFARHKIGLLQFLSSATRNDDETKSATY